MLSMFLMSFLGSSLTAGVGEVAGEAVVEVGEGECWLGGDTGGLDTDLGVRERKAEGPEEELGECIEELREEEGEMREYGANLCCLSRSASMELATPG